MGGLLILTGAGHSTPIVAFADDMIDALKDISPLLEKVADSTVLPMFARNYDRSGLRVHSELLRNALTKRGAQGNILEIRPQGMTLGVDYGTVPYARFVIEGTGKSTGGRIYPKKAKFLSWVDPDTGKRFFAKSVRGIEAHDLLELTPGDLDRIADALAAELVKMGALPIR